MVVIAVFAGIAALFNYFLWANYELPAVLRVISIAAQAMLVVITVAAAIRYRGKRHRLSYDRAGYKIFTLPFALIFVSILGNIAVLTVLSLYMMGFLSSL
jgi:hypothetical protein